jgi:hypothetical protein
LLPDVTRQGIGFIVFVALRYTECYIVFKWADLVPVERIGPSRRTGHPRTNVGSE